jgi:hypothetical protein
MASAIKATLVIPTAAGSRPDLILITDGQIHGSDTVVALGANSGHRLFVLAIGSAPNEALARRISEATGGACEFAATAGEVESAVLRLFSRLRSAPRTLTAVDWPSKPTWTLPAPKGVFPEDTVHLIAGFPTRPSGVLQVSVTDASGHSGSIGVPLAASLTSGDTLARMAAAQRLASLPKSEALALAVRHQLASVHTSFVLVVEREGADANALPSTVTVSQMLAAGWGGTALYRHVCGAPPPQVGSADALLGLDLAHERQACPEAPYPEFAERAKMRELRSPSKKAPETKPSKEDLWMLLRALEQTYAHGNPMPASFAELASRYPVAPALREALKQLIDECGAYTEAECIAAFLALLAAHSRDTAEPEFKKHLISQFTFSRKTRALRQRLLQEVLS